MQMDELASTLEARLHEFPWLDAHTHLVGGKLGARGLHDIVLYHMAVSELYSAGCPSGARLTQFPGWPDQEECHGRICEALPYFARVRGTSISWGVRIILKDLYGWDAPISAENWRKLDETIRERADNGKWHREILRRAGVQRCCTELARSGGGVDADILGYALEWGFFTRCQWGEFDTSLYELERCWGKMPESSAPIGGKARPATERTIRNLDDVREAIQWYVEHIPAERVSAVATHLSTDIQYREIQDEEMASALLNRDYAGLAERDIYASYIQEAYLAALERRHGEDIVFQFSFGAEPLPYETGSRINQETLTQLAEMLGRHPGLSFQCFLSSTHANQSMCTLCREFQNLSLAGYWWHNFFPSIMEHVMSERLDMLPLNRQIGFFSDAYCVEWVYAKAAMVRKTLARILASKIELGQYDVELALSVAREILCESALPLFRPMDAKPH